MTRITIEEVRQVELELPDDFDMDNVDKTIIDLYRRGCISARSKTAYLNFETDEQADWKTIWLDRGDNDALDVINPDDPDIVPIRVNVYPNKGEDYDSHDIEDDVERRMMACDGEQHLELANWEPLVYDYGVNRLRQDVNIR